MPGAQRTKPATVAVAASLAGVIVLVDLSLPLGVAGGVPYVVLVLLGWWFHKRRYIYLLAVVASVLTVAGYFWSPEGGIPWVVLANRFLALLAIWGVAALIGLAKCGQEAQQALRERDTRLHELQADLIHVARLSELAQLASALAHELNQPLTAIMNYVQASRRVMEAGGGRASDRVYAMMDKAVDQVNRAGAIIRRLRAFVEKGETQPFEEDINQVVEEASALAFIGSGEKGVTIGLELGADLPPVLIDKVQIQQVILNLVRNSIEAMAKSKSRQVTITTSHAEAESVEVAICDTGPGLAEEVLDRLFEPFVTTRAEGMGIGLSISRSIVEAHGGRLGATPNPGGGTTFRFTLPMMPQVDRNHDE